MTDKNCDPGATPDERTLADDKWVRIMADYCADGVWDREGCSCDADDLPVSDALRARLRAWQAKYEENDDYLPADHPERRPFDMKAFADEGLEIAKAVKAELRDWTIIYFDEYAVGGATPRSEYEYEVLS